MLPIYNYSSFIFILDFWEMAGGGETGTVELKDRGLMDILSFSINASCDVAHIKWQNGHIWFPRPKIKKNNGALFSSSSIKRDQETNRHCQILSSSSSLLRPDLEFSLILASQQLTKNKDEFHESVILHDCIY